MRPFLKFLLILAFLATPFSANAARLPKAKRIQSVSLSFFNRYGKKYPDTQFGQKNLKQVLIHSVQEISYHNAYADVDLQFKDGKNQRALLKITKRPPKGWRVSSWELLKN